MAVLLYRARLEAAEAIVAVSVHPHPHTSGLGDEWPVCLRVTIRYALASGAVRLHRGELQSAGPPEQRWVVAGYQCGSEEVLVSLQPSPPAGRHAERREEAVVTDQLRLPFGVTAWGVIGLTGVRTAVRCHCSSGTRALTVRGTVWLELQSPAATLRLRIPFCRLLASESGPELHWQAKGRVSGLNARVEPGGRISGRIGLALCCNGAPRQEPRQPPQGQGPVLDFVRNLAGRVVRAEAEHLGEEQVLARGNADIDLYWMDETGRSRWTGRTLPFAAVLPALAGLQAEDRLEAAAEIQRLTPVRRGRQLSAQLLIGLRVTALRDVVGSLRERQYRLREVVGETEGTVTLVESILGAPEAEQRAEPVQSWHELSDRCWTVAELGADPRTDLGVEAGDSAAQAWAADMDLPGAVRTVLGLAFTGGSHPRAKALVALEGGGLHLVQGDLTQVEPTDSSRLTAMPVLAGDQWRLRFLLGNGG